MSEWKTPTPIQLAKRIEAWQHRLSHLGIAHFRIRAVHLVDETPGGPHAEASVRPSSSYDSAEFWFTHSFLEGADERDLDTAIVHEWLHVAWRDFDAALDCPETWMPEGAYGDFVARVHHEREGLVERFARTIVGFYNGKG